MSDYARDKLNREFSMRENSTWVSDFEARRVAGAVAMVGKLQEIVDKIAIVIAMVMGIHIREVRVIHIKQLKHMASEVIEVGFYVVGGEHADVLSEVRETLYNMYRALDWELSSLRRARTYAIKARQLLINVFQMQEVNP